MNESLPRCVYKRGPSYYLVKKGKWTFITKDKSKIRDVLERNFGLKDGVVPQGNYEPNLDAALKEHLLNAFRRARQNAKQRKTKLFTLTEEQVLGLYRTCKGKCSVTMTPLSLAETDALGRRPFAPSIDRIDSSIGYTAENCRIVCLAANIAMNTWGESVLHQMIAHASKSDEYWRNSKSPKNAPENGSVTS